MRNLILISALVLLTSTAAARNEQNVYKWYDEDGNLHYGDKIPVEYSDQPKQRLNDQAVPVEHLEGKKTEEQLAAEALEKERIMQIELQRRADQALLATYLSVEEIVMHRDRRVELFQAQAKVTELYLSNLNRRLDSIRKEASKFQPYSDDANAPLIGDDLSEDLNSTKETIARHERNLEKYELEEKDIFERFNQDIERFKVLKGITAPAQAASTSP